KAHKPAWYDYADPQSLRDLGSSPDLDAIARDGLKDWDTPQRIKADLLIAQDRSEPLTRRGLGLEVALYHLAALCRRSDERIQLFASVYDDPRFGEVLRHGCFVDAMVDEQLTPQLLADLRRHPLAAVPLKPERRRTVDEIAAYVALDFDSPEQIEKYALA